MADERPHSNKLIERIGSSPGEIESGIENTIETPLRSQLGRTARNPRGQEWLVQFKLARGFRVLGPD